MFKPNEAIDKRMEKLATVVGKKTSRRGFLDRLTKALLTAGAGTIAWLPAAASAATPLLQDCYSACDTIEANCDASCVPACSNPNCSNCCATCWGDCNTCCVLLGIPCDCPNCCVQ